MQEREVAPEVAEWQAQRAASFQLRTQQPPPEPARPPLLPLHTAQPAGSHPHQSSLSSLLPGDPITPHKDAGSSNPGGGGDRPGGSSSSSASEAGDGDGDGSSHPPSSRTAAASSVSDSPHVAAPRHRAQPSWPRLSTSGALA